VNGFPTMALTTLATVGLGVARIVIQRRAYPRGTPERTEAAQAAYRPRAQVLPRRVGATSAKAAPSGKTVPSGQAVPSAKEMPTSAGMRPGPNPRRRV